jgi:3-phenylpropionate/trans-cinnamate dioxygenase ferredoxin subunit
VRRISVGRADEIAPGEMKMVQVDATQVLIVNLDGEFHAMQGICSHEYFELDQGFITGDSLTCALHLSRFDIASGDALDPPAELPLAKYPVLVEQGELVLELPEGEIPVNG